MQNKREIEIDARDLLAYLKKHILNIIIIPLLAAVITFGVTSFLITPTYESQSMIYITSGDGSMVQNMLSSLQAGSALTEDYKTLATSKPVLEQVIKELDLDMTYEELEESVSTENPDNTRILTLKVRHKDKATAKKIVDKLTEIERNKVADVMEMAKPTVMQWGDIQKEPVSPSPVKDTVMIAFIALMLSVIFYIIRFIQNDNIINSGDIEKTLSLRNLAEVPMFTSEHGRRKK